MEPTTHNAKAHLGPRGRGTLVRSFVWTINIDIVDQNTPDERRYIVYDDFFNYRGLGPTPEAALVSFLTRNEHDYDGGGSGGLYLPGAYGRHSPMSLTESLMSGEGGSSQPELEPTANPNLPTME